MLSTENTGLYDDLKAFKDERKRPAVNLIEIPGTILSALEKRLATLIVDKALANIAYLSFRRWLEYYAASIPNHEAGLLDRRDMMSLFWSTIFASDASVTL